MKFVDMSNNTPSNSHAKDFASPALTLSLAGIFRDGAAGNEETEEVDDGSAGGGRREETTMVEISSENSVPLMSTLSRSRDDFDAENEDYDDPTNSKKKKYHRHTAHQIRELEALFKESPHPDEKQRQQLSNQLGLHPRQVKFWFQNRRTQIKAIQERHENSLLKTEIDKLREVNKALRMAMKKNIPSCPSCGFSSSSKEAAVVIPTQEQQLRIENARPKTEVEKLRAELGKYTKGTSPTTTSEGNDEENKNGLELQTNTFGLEKSRIMDIVNQATEELKKMATFGEPLWIKSFETGREILNYDEYMKEFPTEKSGEERLTRSIEASRDTGVVSMDLPRLVQCFMDVNQWKETFPGMITKASTLDVIRNGEGDNWVGAVQLMFAELQMLTPVVGTRKVYFLRYCKQLGADQWAIVDVSVDKVEDNIDASLMKCRKLPSGCILQDQSNAHCKVTWVEHLECQQSTVHSLYHAIVNSGQAFGARHWMATLQQQCERLTFFKATSVRIKDSTGPDVATLAGRKSILKLAQRMTWSFCHAIGASSYNKWDKIHSKTGDDIRVASRKNLTDPREPFGLILCATSSVWLPFSRNVLFDFLRDETRQHECNIMSNGGPVESIANLATGQDRGNAVTIQAMKLKEDMWILQDTCTNAYESTVVYAPIDIGGMKSVMTGRDSSNVAVLPSGFSILPDGLESRSLVITSRPEEKCTGGGSLLTVLYQILTSNSPAVKLSKESVESVNNLISCTLHRIKTSLQCEDG
ncbi:homeobox-leucine zipper protein GLABRA 2 isoform X1 [Nicotiana tomentosiformis]|uniref:homeobox-leucine zipper protein GLABRA 2 isoform X1 n=1 Tax=Nicotiana tomentosiformis TaxID=4098 RepID=UPI00051C71DE|nr:homeobox-leucine zipper protein GLABRA 2 isoform X1 [Nicotiana tomentosiformis]